MPTTHSNRKKYLILLAKVGAAWCGAHHLGDRKESMNFETIMTKFSKGAYRDADWSHHVVSDMMTVSTLHLEDGWIIVNAHDEWTDDEYLLHGTTVISPTGQIYSALYMEDMNGDNHLPWQQAATVSNEDLDKLNSQ